MIDEDGLMSVGSDLASGDVHVWHFWPGVSCDLDACWSLLSPPEQERSSRLADVQAARHFVVGRATVRRILAHYLDCKPSAINITTGPYGKPDVADCPIHVNWSHSGARWLMALATLGPVGVDLEQVSVGFEWQGPASIAFHPNEQQFVQSGLIRPERFFRIWVRKEALLKATGVGLSDKLANISVADLDGTLRGEVRMPDGKKWFLVDGHADTGYAAALAAAFPISRQVEFSSCLAMEERVQ
jgi:4'-phosphopantetheinyl transferase